MYGRNGESTAFQMLLQLPSTLITMGLLGAGIQEHLEGYRMLTMFGEQSIFYLSVLMKLPLIALNYGKKAGRGRMAGWLGITQFAHMNYSLLLASHRTSFCDTHHKATDCREGLFITL